MQSKEGIALQAALITISNISSIKSFSRDSQLVETLEYRLSEVETVGSESLGEILCKLAETRKVTRDYLTAGRCGSALLLNYLLSKDASLLIEERTNLYFRGIIRSVHLNVQKQIELCRDLESLELPIEEEEAFEVKRLNKRRPGPALIPSERYKSSSLSDIESSEDENESSIAGPSTQSNCSKYSKGNRSSSRFSREGSSAYLRRSQSRFSLEVESTKSERRGRQYCGGLSPTPHFQLQFERKVALKKLQVGEELVPLEDIVAEGGEEEEEQSRAKKAIEDIEEEEEDEAMEEIEEIIEKEVVQPVEKELAVEPVEKVIEVEGVAGGNRPVEALKPIEAVLPQPAKPVAIPQPIEEAVEPIVVARPFEANQAPIDPPIVPRPRVVAELVVPEKILQEFNERYGFKRQVPNHIFGSNAATVGSRNICIGAYDDDYLRPAQSYSLFTSDDNLQLLKNGSTGIGNPELFHLFKSRKLPKGPKGRPIWCYGGDYTFKDKKIHSKWRHFGDWGFATVKRALPITAAQRRKALETKEPAVPRLVDFLSLTEFKRQWPSRKQITVKYANLECVSFDEDEFAVYVENRRLGRDHFDCPPKKGKRKEKEAEEEGEENEEEEEEEEEKEEEG